MKVVSVLAGVILYAMTKYELTSEPKVRNRARKNISAQQPRKRMAAMAAGLVAMSLLGSAPLQATVLVENLGNSTFMSLTHSDNFWRASSFTTNTSAWILDSVMIDLATPSNTSPTFTLNIYDDAGGIPGTLLTALLGDPSPGPGIETYTGSLALSASTTYWIVGQVSAGSGGRFRTDVTLDSRQTGEPGASIGNSMFTSDNDGTSWRLQGNFPIRFQVDASEVLAVSEPGTMWLLAVALGGFGWRHRRELSEKLRVGSRVSDL